MEIKVGRGMTTEQANQWIVKKKLGDGAEGHYTRVYVTCQI